MRPNFDESELPMFDPVEAKAGARVNDLEVSGLLELWRERQRAFVANLSHARIRSLLMDYDGTVYAGGMLHGAVPDNDILVALSSLARSGVAIGFASGRGESLREALRQGFARELWPYIYVAYQDGAEVGHLDDDSLPTRYDRAREDPRLKAVRSQLEMIFSGWINTPAMRPENQLLGIYADLQTAPHVFAACCAVAIPLGLKVFTVGRMIDITLPHVSKRNLENMLARPGSACLAIGDAGEWPGNDCELLASPLGLSVGSVSADPGCCWRLTAEAGVEGTRKILRALESEIAEGETVLRLRPDLL